MPEITLKQLLEAGAHFGHQPRRWNPKMEPYIYAQKEGIHIFDLVITKNKLEDAYEFVRDLTKEGKTIIFVGTKRQATEIIAEEAKRAGVPFVAQRWLGGTVTNWSQIKKSVDKLAKMKEEKEAGEYDKYTKKEQILLDREIARLERFFGGLSSLEDLPDAVFIVDIQAEKAAVKEANMKDIPVVAMVDSNCDPTLVDYVIPINDDAIRSIKLVVSYLADAVIDGGQMAKKKNSSKKKTVKKE